MFGGLEGLDLDIGRIGHGDVNYKGDINVISHAQYNTIGDIFRRQEGLAVYDQ